jgi:alkyldihydroxyacetonephosphate synthase
VNARDDSARIAIDRTSLLVEVSGESTLDQIETELRASGLTLAVDASALAMTVREWIDRGAPGARDAWSDPVDQLVAGFEATLKDGRALSIRPAPRRAVGPDLQALVLGCGGRFATLTKAWLRVHFVDAARALRADAPPFVWPRDPVIESGESKLLDAIDAALREQIAPRRV